ncbi:hypothetical protein [Sporosarcina sp. E16_8]|uniref:hypothetical protein n=1 Tax=Sporosarcina sp. E16_8 TaxID=2789295 RepID=UPI001A9388CA|nr:hypothetical protein [Sporosarcina sp. E16_8]MBO0589495.1 hypothetical protein [Sporosarcina sp. E16_8]
MLNKIIKVILLVVLLFGVSLYNVDTANAETKVMWGETEFKAGQIGKITVLANTPLVKVGSNGKLTTVRTLKKGEGFRVYQYKNQNGGLYGIGGGTFVQKNSKVKYETPSKNQLVSLSIVSGGLAPKIGLNLTYYPNFTDDSQRRFTVSNESSGGKKYISLIYGNSFTGGYSYTESSRRISMGVNETDWVLFDFAYPMIQGKQTKSFYLDEDWDEVFEYVHVKSTTSTVTVKAGTFKNVVIIKYSNGGTYYFAPGYGVIKAVDPDGKIVTELISIH